VTMFVHGAGVSGTPGRRRVVFIAAWTWILIPADCSTPWVRRMQKVRCPIDVCTPDRRIHPVNADHNQTRPL